MRLLAAVLVLALAGCSPPSNSASDPPPTRPAEANAARVTRATGAAPAITPSQLGGQWSFDRNCGLYDLVFTNDDATYYDYSDPSHAIGYDGPYTIAGNRVVLTMRRLDGRGAPSGDPVTYNLDVSAPVTSDLVGHFGPAGGAAHDIDAKKCANEDRE